MIESRDHTDTSPGGDDASWVYLSHLAQGAGPENRLRERVVEVCEASGWYAVSWPLEERTGRGVDPGRFFEGVRHAVEHAGVVVAFIGEEAELTDAELTLAYSYRRPIIGVCISDTAASGVQSMLQGYERAHVITCTDVEGCAISLGAAFSDPDFEEVVRLAANEHAEDA